MFSKLFILALLALRFPTADSFRPLEWQPAFLPERQVEICSETVGFVTHSSWSFDGLGTTRPGVNATVRNLKADGWPVIYFHDRYNPNNPAWSYLYDDWQPTAFVGSDIGHFQIDLTGVQHAVCLGGYFGQCERATVGDVVRNWQRLPRRDDLRITQIVDATFTVAQYLPDGLELSSQIRAVLRERQQKHLKAVLSVDEVLVRLKDWKLQIPYLQRQMPGLPYGVNVAVDFFGDIYELRRHSKEAPTLTFAYRRSNDFLEYTPVQLIWPKPKPLEP